ncbi:MAG TPA: hypothetical protein VLV83_06025 [Acidobacteriota bacterium]|nr:hypothetical protein [Acidobacteriota bacterium]
MWNAFWAVATLLAVLAAAPAGEREAPDGQIDLDANSVLVYRNQARDQSSRFIVRLARFKPDIVLEWENLNDQGTVHLYRKAVAEGQQFTVSGLFEVGVEMESEDEMTLWMPEEAFRQLSEKGSVKIKRSNLPFQIKRSGRTNISLTLNGREVEVPALQAKDSRGGEWLVLDDLSNPLLLAYETRYFKQRLEIINTEDRRPLRWIKNPPPIK